MGFQKVLNTHLLKTGPLKSVPGWPPKALVFSEMAAGSKCTEGAEEGAYAPVALPVR